MRAFSFLFVATLVASSAFAADNPDPDHIHGKTGDAVISLTPHNSIDDFRNLQWAFDNVQAGGTVELGAGTFFMGDNDTSPRKTAILKKGLTLRGVKEGRIWRTTIRGGGEVMTPGVGGALESGPLRLMLEGDDHPVKIENIWFRKWSCEVVYIESCNGFEFRNCRITDPVNAADPSKIRYVHALWTMGNDARGDFIAEDNLVEMGEYDGELAEDEQFMGIFSSNHDNIRIRNNTIVGTDEAIEILMNRYGDTGAGDPKAASSPATIEVTGNTIDVTGTPGPRWGGSWAILIAGNLNSNKVLIENNDVTKRGKGFGIGLSGNNFEIKNNTFHFEEFNGERIQGAIQIGGYPVLAGREMGPNLTDSVIAGNTWTGVVGDAAVLFNPGSGKFVNKSTGNRIDFSDGLNDLDAKTTLSVSPEVAGNTFTGKMESVKDGSKEGANTFK